MWKNVLPPLTTHPKTFTHQSLFINILGASSTEWKLNSYITGGWNGLKNSNGNWIPVNVKRQRSFSVLEARVFFFFSLFSIFSSRSEWIFLSLEKVSKFGVGWNIFLSLISTEHSQFLSSFFPHPMTVQLVPATSSFMSVGGKHTGNKWSWNATRVASCRWKKKNNRNKIKTRLNKQERLKLSQFAFPYLKQRNIIVVCNQVVVLRVRNNFFDLYLLPIVCMRVSSRHAQLNCPVV